MDARHTILIADDKQSIRSVLRDIFHQYRVIECPNGTEAVKLAAAEGPDLIITDLLMPELDGFAVCRAIRANSRTAYIPVLLMTGVADQNIVFTALDAGADHVIAKPLDLPELRLRVRNAVNRKALTDQLILASAASATRPAA